MLLKLYVSYGLKEGRPSEINFLCFVPFDTVAATSSLSYAD